MKKWIALFLSAMMLMSTGIALATNPETGEQVNVSGRTLSVYDRVVLESFPAASSYRGISASQKQEPQVALKTVMANLAADTSISEFSLQGEEKLLNASNLEKIANLEQADKVEALMLALGLVNINDVSDAVKAAGIEQQPFFDADAGTFAEGLELETFTAEGIANGGLESGFGFFTIDGTEFPFVRIAVEVVQKAEGGYVGLSEEERTFIENYNFIYEDGQWQSYSILRAVKSLF